MSLNGVNAAVFSRQIIDKSNVINNNIIYKTELRRGKAVIDYDS